MVGVTADNNYILDVLFSQKRVEVIDLTGISRPVISKTCRQVKTIISEALERTNGNYKDALGLFNIDAADYTKFMKFLYRNRLN